MESYEKFEKLATKKAKYTAKERELIVQAAAEFGIRLNTLCPDCYHDAAVQIALKVREEKEPREAKNAGGYVLRAGTNVVLQSKGRKFHVNETELTEENARLWLAYGLPAYYFEQTPETPQENEDNEQNKVD